MWQQSFFLKHMVKASVRNKNVAAGCIEELGDDWTICTISKDMHITTAYLGKPRRYTTIVQGLGLRLR